MVRWLKIRYLLICCMIEAALLWVVSSGIRAVPLEAAVFLSFREISGMSMLMILVFVLTRLCVFLLVCACADWYRENSQFASLRLERKDLLQKGWTDIFLSSVILHLLLSILCGSGHIIQGMVEGVLLAWLLWSPGKSSVKFYPFLFLLYLLLCLILN